MSAQSGLAARLDNRGTILLNQPLTLDKSGAHHVNSGLVKVSNDLTITQSTAGSFTNTGSIDVAAEKTAGFTPSGSATNISLTMTPNAARIITNSASVTSDRRDPNSFDNTAVIETSIIVDTDGDGVADETENAAVLLESHRLDGTPLDLMLLGADPRRSVFSGSVRRPKRSNSDGIVTLRSLTGLDTVRRNRLPDSIVSSQPGIQAAVVDRLLEEM